MDRFITVEDARRRILEAVTPLEPERCSLSEGRERFAASEIVAPHDSPRFDNSSRDGYAARWSDLREAPVDLELIDMAAAGAPATTAVEPGTAARIATGGRIPSGADTVVMQEYCTVDGTTVHVESAPDPGRGAWIRRAGGDVEAGDTLVESGRRLDAADIGMLASFGRARLPVARRPRVAIVSTGDELVDLDERPDDSEIIDSNAYLLEALVEASGAEPWMLPIAEDTAGAVRTCLRRALRAGDLVVSSGGVSVGDRDEVRGVADELTDGLEFWKIRMKPGKPLVFGRAEDGGPTPLVGLPGNPNSCFVGFHQFVDSLLQVLQGRAPAEFDRPGRLRAHLTDRLSSTARRRHYVAGRLALDSPGDRPEFHPARAQRSGNVALFSAQNAFGVVPEGCDELASGEPIDVEPLPLRW